MSTTLTRRTFAALLAGAGALAMHPALAALPDPTTTTVVNPPEPTHAERWITLMGSLAPAPAGARVALLGEPADGAAWFRVTGDELAPRLVAGEVLHVRSSVAWVPGDLVVVYAGDGHEVREVLEGCYAPLGTTKVPGMGVGADCFVWGRVMTATRRVYQPNAGVRVNWHPGPKDLPRGAFTVQVAGDEWAEEGAPKGAVLVCSSDAAPDPADMVIAGRWSHGLRCNYAEDFGPAWDVIGKVLEVRPARRGG